MRIKLTSGNCIISNPFLGFDRIIIEDNEIKFQKYVSDWKRYESISEMSIVEITEVDLGFAGKATCYRTQIGRLTIYDDIVNMKFGDLNIISKFKTV